MPKIAALTRNGPSIMLRVKCKNDLFHKKVQVQKKYSSKKQAIGRGGGGGGMQSLMFSSNLTLTSNLTFSSNLTFFIRFDKFFNFDNSVKI